MTSKTNIKLEVNKDQLRIWIAALRSGEYRQTEGTLQNQFGYCCLGVACKVIIPLGQQLRDSKGLLQGVSPYFQPHAPHWLREINGDFGIHNDDNLIVLNDQEDITFSEIADLLEKTYLQDETPLNT